MEKLHFLLYCNDDNEISLISDSKLGKELVNRGWEPMLSLSDIDEVERYLTVVKENKEHPSKNIKDIYKKYDFKKYDFCKVICS